MGSFESKPVDTKEFRRALSRFATGVAVVTGVGAEGHPFGMTVSSLNSVSVEPPLLLFSIARTAVSLPRWTNTRAIGISVLEHSQRDLSDRFARAQSDKWAGCDYSPGENGAPLLSQAIAHFECAPYAQYEGGDHLIFLVHVRRFANLVEGRPLIFFRGGYHSLAQDLVA
ncbi:MAG: putative FMN-binding flavin reductase [Hyphomicrobiales bacterium]|nr:putative FMN-binding flavin reductase [Hyphomicrobiales bacterium]